MWISPIMSERRFIFQIPLYFELKTTITISDYFRLHGVFEIAEFNGIF